MVHWSDLLGLRAKRLTPDTRRETSRTIRILAITADDRFYSVLVDIAASSGWEIRRAANLVEGLDAVRSHLVPLVLFDWDENGHDWRSGVKRLASTSLHPCVLLTSRVADENLRQEVIRFHGYDILPRSAGRDQVVRTIQFAWFWITRRSPEEA